ncbi:MAG: hypothetical protein N2D54_06425, partial [Chloroflexota bacterium]
AYQTLFDHQNIDGGLTTYLPSSPIIGMIGAPSAEFLKGWTSSHACVTAAAAGLIKFKKHISIFDYLIKKQSTGGNWVSYWWMDNEYATALAVEGLAKGLPANQNTRAIQKAVDWILSRMNNYGTVLTNLHPNGSPFGTALAIKILMAAPNQSQVEGIITLAVNWLLKNQFEDGAWEASASLRIPPPGLIDVESFEGWEIRNDIDAGTIKMDNRKIMTTATVFEALSAIDKRY